MFDMSALSQMLEHFAPKLLLSELARLPTKGGPRRTKRYFIIGWGSFYGNLIFLHMDEDYSRGVPHKSCSVVFCLVLKGQAFEMFKFELWFIFFFIIIAISKSFLFWLLNALKVVKIWIISWAAHRTNLSVLSERDLFSQVAFFAFGWRSWQEVWGTVNLLHQLERGNVELWKASIGPNYGKVSLNKNKYNYFNQVDK